MRQNQLNASLFYKNINPQHKPDICGGILSPNSNSMTRNLK